MTNKGGLSNMKANSKNISKQPFWGKVATSVTYQRVCELIFTSPLRQFIILAGLPLLYLLTQHLGPMLQMLRVSLMDAYPVAPGHEGYVTLKNFGLFFNEPVFWKPFVRTLTFAAAITLVTLIITYPVAYYLARHVKKDHQMILLLLVLIPFWTGEIVRTYAIMILLGNNGAINLALKFLGIIDRPIPFMYTGFSVSVGLIYLTALYMLLPLYSALEKLSKNVTEAAADLGAGPWTRFWRVTLPMSLEGVGAGSVLVFLISTGYYGTPVLLGGPNSTVFAETIAGFFHNAGDEWPTGAAFAIIMFITALAIAGGLNRLFNALRKGDT